MGEGSGEIEVQTMHLVLLGRLAGTKSAYDHCDSCIVINQACGALWVKVSMQKYKLLLLNIENHEHKLHFQNG